MDPELKKIIERNKQEALKKQEIFKEQQRLWLLNEAKNKSPAINNKHSSVVNNQRYSPYPKSNSPGQQSSVLRNYNSKAVSSTVTSTSPYKQSNIANYLVPKSPITNQPPSLPKISSNSSASTAKEGNATATTSSNRQLKAKFSLISEHRFQVRCDYDQQVIDEFKKIPSKAYNSATKLWSFALKDHTQLVRGLRLLNKDIAIDLLPEFIMKRMLSESLPMNESWLEQIDQKLLDSLLPFQKAGVLFGISRQGRVLIADDPGLGKTRQALGIVNYFKNLPVLIVTNASTREFWQDEIIKVLNTTESSVCVLSKDSYWERADYIICSYNSLDSNYDALKGRNFGTIIFDESHHIKNQKAKQTINAQKLSKGAKRIVMLTGTPALSRPVELYPQLEILDGNIAGYKAFTVRYCNGHTNAFGYNATGSSNLEELKHLLNKTVMIRRVKDDVYSELDSKKRECVIVQDITIPQSTKNDFEEYSSLLVDKEKANAKDEILLSWYQYTAEIKMEAACSFLDKLLSMNSDKILAFAHHKVMMNALSAHLEKLQVPHIRIDGAVSGSLRSERIEIFQNNPNIRVAVLSTLAANAGITLTAASTVCFFELEFNPSTIIQAEARAHRIGQKEQVKIYFLIAPNTADDVIWKMIVKKQSDLGKAGLVDKVEFLSSTMETTKFSITQQSQEGLSSVSGVQKTTPEESNESTDTFYSCSTNVNTSPPSPNQLDESKEQIPKCNINELEELKRMELDFVDFSDDSDDDILDNNVEDEENNEQNDKEAEEDDNDDEMNSQELRDLQAMEDEFLNTCC